MSQPNAMANNADSGKPSLPEPMNTMSSCKPASTGQTTGTYDGANRRIQETDALGNVMQYKYDGNSNVIFNTRIEKCTITQPVVADETFRSAMRYDSLNRLVVRADQGATGTLRNGGEISSRCSRTRESSDRSLTTSATEVIACHFFSADLSDAETIFTLTGYDSRHNPTLAIDPKRNSTITVFDGASRTTQVQQHLRIAGLGENPPHAGTTLLPFGGASIVTTTFYDANSRVKRLVDDRGDVTDYEYDTLDRETVMRFHDGSTRIRVYNEASDVIQFTDENGSVFDNTFDALRRKTACTITKAAGVVGTDEQSFEYDGLSRQTQSIDTVGATNATVEMSYDSLNRVIEDSQAYTGGTRNVTTTGFSSHPISQLQFPNNRKIDNTYDLLYRRTDVSDTGGSSIAAWQFFGPSRVAELTMGNGLICTQMNNDRTRSSIQENQTEDDWQGQVTPPWGGQSSDRLGYDGASRMITKRYLADGVDPITFGYLNSSAVVGFTTSFDRSSNKFFERHLHAESRSHLYEPFNNGRPQGGYDSIDRLRQYQRGVLSATGGNNNLGGGGIETPISLPNTDQNRTYDLDGLGNWRRTTFEAVGGAETTEVRQHNALNQITSRDSTPFSYDLNGNLLDDGIRLYTWDALNRLANVRRKSDGLVIGDYTYDATARRIRKVVTNGGLSGTIPNGTTHYLYTGWQCVEECDGFGSPLKQYVWGIYIDELLQQRLLTTINNHGAGDYYPLTDLLYRTTALTDGSANIIEAYDTDAYGNTLIFTAPGTGNNWWADDAVQSDNPTCAFIFTGRRFDSDGHLYFYRSRWYLSQAGRFTSRDPELFNQDFQDTATKWNYMLTGRSERGLYAFVHSNPVRNVDTFGRVATSIESVNECDSCTTASAEINLPIFGPPPCPHGLQAESPLGLLVCITCIGLCPNPGEECVPQIILVRGVPAPQIPGIPPPPFPLIDPREYFFCDCKATPAALGTILDPNPPMDLISHVLARGAVSR